jgi:hypothetical protein
VPQFVSCSAESERSATEPLKGCRHKLQKIYLDQRSNFNVAVLLWHNDVQHPPKQRAYNCDTADSVCVDNLDSVYGVAAVQRNLCYCAVKKSYIDEARTRKERNQRRRIAMGLLFTMRSLVDCNLSLVTAMGCNMNRTASFAVSVDTKRLKELEWH